MADNPEPKGFCHRVSTKLSRRKWVDLDESTNKLRRALTTLDLTFLSIGSTIGVGVYVLAGSVARNLAGPAVLLSFMIAAVASVLAGLCYAELGTRVPKAGSAYVYTYVCVGECVAFIVGWNLILEYVIGVASVAKGYSTHLDALLNGAMQDAFRSYLPIHGSVHLSPYFDPFAFAVTMVITCILAFGVKESSTFNNIFTGLKLIVVLFIIIAGSVFANPSNWTIDPTTVNMTALVLSNPQTKVGQLGIGGFIPFGWGGVMRGAATCFYAFVGFDCIATTGEEAKTPQRSIPLSLLLSLSFVTVAYIGISVVLTMMVPYYLQDEHAAVPEAFQYVHFPIGKWIASIGALVGFSASLLGVMFPMPRVIYAMATDGLLFGFLGRVNRKTQTPLAATMLGGIFGAIMASIFDLDALVDMMSIGTLTAYTFVAIGVLLLRYRADEETSSLKFTPGTSGWRHFVGQFRNANASTNPTKLSSSYTGWAVGIYSGFAVGLCALGAWAGEELASGSLGYIIPTCMIAVVLIAILFSLSLQPISKVQLTFKVPLVPLVPGLSILANVYLITQLSGSTWLRFGIWLLIGMLIYLYCLISGASDRAYRLNAAGKPLTSRKYSIVSANKPQNANSED